MHVQRVQGARDPMVFIATVRRSAVPCPQCGQLAHRVHSRYRRQLADQPWNGVRVQIRLTSRRWFCDRKECPQRIFTERLPGVVRRYARRTEAQRDLLHLIACGLGGQAGAQLARECGIDVSPDTVLRQLRRRGVFVGPAPRVLGVDDWAWRKGCRYGTLLVDLEAGCPIELLPDRQADTLARWLREHPGAEIVTRDRSTGYGAAIREGAPQAVQVADRWHLLKNLTAALEATLAHQSAALRQATSPQAAALADPPAVPETPASPPAVRAGRSQRELERREAARGRRLARYEAVQRLKALGWNQIQIAAQVGLTRETVKQYMEAEQFPERKQNVSRSQELGKVTPRRVLWWLLLPQNRTEAQTAYLTRLEALCPEIRTARALVQAFFTLARERAGERLKPWTEQVQESGLSELERFSRGLREDWAAVVAGLTLPWSNGPTEGHVNRLKLVKRQMYGRASFELLRGRYLARPHRG